MRYTPDNIEKLQPNEVIVFGSNERGQHGGGLAKVAQQFYGAEWGKSEGHFGQSYALPTKSTPWKTLPLEAIEYYAKVFKMYAAANPDLTFLVTKVGCGLAGLTPEQIGPMFHDAPDNVVLPYEFLIAILDAHDPNDL